MNITVFHKTKLGYTAKIFKNARVRILDKVKLSDANSESNKSAVVRIFTKENLDIFTNDRCIFYETHDKNPPGDAYVIKSICDNRQGILSHIRIDCVC